MISETEYVSKKHALVNEKAELKGKLEAFEQARANRFEPSLAFVNEAKNAAFLLVQKDRDKNRDFLRKLDSNLHVAEQALTVEFNNPWKYVADFNATAITTLAACGENSQEENWRRGTLLHPFCHLVLRAVRVVPPPWVLDPTIRSQTLRNYRLQANLSQTALAAKLGVTLSAVARWEQGKATPNRESWTALQALLLGL